MDHHNSDIDTPQFGFPLHQHGGGLLTHYVEQDSDEHALDQVEVLFRTELGSRDEVPDYGIPDQNFRQGGANIEELLSAAREWAPAAVLTIERNPDLQDALLDRLRVTVAARSEDA